MTQPILKRLILPSATELHFVLQNRIVYCKAEGSYTIVHLDNDSELTVAQGLSKISEQLSESAFLRVSRSAIVNVYAIERLDKQQKVIVLNNKCEIPYTVPYKRIKTFLTSLP